jgi:tetratricopeptide (TPR) repeat protein
VIGDQRDEGAERPARGVPCAERARIVVEEREEYLLREILDLLADVAPLSSRAAPAHERLRDPSVHDRADALHKRTNRLGIPGNRTRDEVGGRVVHGAVVPQLVRPRAGWYDARVRRRTPTASALRVLRVLRVLLVALLLGIEPACTKLPPAAPPDQPLAVLVSGCAALVVEQPGAAPACTPGTDGHLRLYVPCQVGDRVDVDPPVAAPTPRNVAGGRLFTVTPPERARSITIRRTDVGGTRASYTQILAARPPPAWFGEAQGLRQKGELDPAQARVTTALASPTVTDEDRALAEGLLARIALRRGKVDDADRHFRAAIGLDKRTGRISDRADDAFALVFMLHQRSRHYPEARRVLDEVANDLVAYPDGRAREPLYRGQVAWEAGDTRGALRLLAVAIERADQLGADGIARAARQVRGMVMCNAGTTESCVATLREAERDLANAEGVTACERAELALGLGYAELEAAQNSGARARVAQAGDSDLRALGLLDKGCPDTYLRTVALEHLALADALNDRPREAAARLALAKAQTPEPRISDALFWSDVEARIAMLDHEPALALAAFDTERARATAAQRDGEVWRALVGRGRVLEGLGKTSEALDAYRAADDVIEDAIVAVPFGEGRSSVSAESRDGTNRAAALLSRLGRDAEALDVVRRARSRLVRSLARTEQVAALTGADRDRWERSIADYRSAREQLDGEAAGDWKKARPALEAAIADRKTRLARLRATLDDAMAVVGATKAARALPPLPSDELVLAYVDLGGATGAVGFAVEGGKVRSFRLGPDHRDTSSAPATPRAPPRDELLAPVAGEIARARRIRVFADGAFAAIDMHALTWGDGPLVAHVPVVYGLDLGPAPRATTGKAALVVSDPTGDLPSSRDEGNAALVQLAKRYDARKLAGTEATAAHVRDALPGLAFLHYAGHGAFAGREGAESALPLAQGSALTVGDVLALHGAPERVVLSGCEAGRQLGAREEGAAGIASAFLVAGATEVVAPVRVVDDRAASALARDLHAALDAKGDRDLAAALQAAQLRSFREGRPGWEAFRVFAR